MTRQGKALLEQFKVADRLDPAALERMSEGLQSRLERGDMGLPGIDVKPPELPKVSLLAKLLTSASAKVGIVLVGLGMGTAVFLWGSEGGGEKGVSATASATTTTTTIDQGVPVVGTYVPQISAEASGTGSELARAPDRGQRGESRSERRLRRRVARVPVQRTTTLATHQASVSAPSSASAPESGLRPSAARSEPSRAQGSSERVAEPEVDKSLPESAPEPPTPQASDLAAELALIRRATTQLNAGKPQNAIVLLDEHAESFPHGALEQAREVQRMLALCAMGQEGAARTRAGQFLARFPKSALAGKVRRMCPPASAPAR